MAVIVQKYGGSSVADADKLRAVARRVVETRKQGFDVVVVVSAMGKTTDQLLAQARQVSPEPDHRELDMLLSVGERISMSLLAMAINDLGHKAISFTGSQSGIITDTSHVNARILEVRPTRILQALSEGRIAIVAGYQGVSLAKEITTLGRGGSDTTAIALAAALQAEYCEICSDVDGVYSADPRDIPQAHRIAQLSHGEMLELSLAGAKVLCAEAVEYARKYGITIHAASTFQNTGYTTVAASVPSRASFVAVTLDRLLVGLRISLSDAEVLPALTFLSERGVLVRFVEVLETAPGRRQLTAWFRTLNVPNLAGLESDARGRWGQDCLLLRELGTVTAVGRGVGERPELLCRALEVAQQLPATVRGCFQTPHGISLLLPQGELEACQALLHEALVENPAGEAIPPA